jgi:hypothetical protein
VEIYELDASEREDEKKKWVANFRENLIEWLQFAWPAAYQIRANKA